MTILAAFLIGAIGGAALVVGIAIIRAVRAINRSEFP